MSRKLWLKGALLIAAGTLLQLGSGCYDAIVQRILVAVAFD